MTLVLTTEGGTVTVPGGVLGAIAVRAAESVDGIRVRRRRSAVVDVEARHVRLAVAARRGEPLVELGERAQDAVAAAFQAMCGIETRIDVELGELE
jgi:uncharacterized alkaline shock family protein YloU